MQHRLAIFLILTLAIPPTAIKAQEKNADAGKQFHVPYKLTDTAHVLVRIKINGQGPFNYIIDTGSPFTFVSTKIAKQLKISANKQRKATVKRFAVEGGVGHQNVQVLVHTPFQLEGMNAMNFAGVELHGIIGYDLLAQYKMEFDFSRHKMKWTRLNFKPPPPKLLKVKGGAPGGLSAIGGLMKMLSWIVGKKHSPKQVVSGFVGVELRAKKGKVVIGKVYRSSPAANAGLRQGDVLLQVKGEKAATIADVQKQLAEVRPGETVDIRIGRGEREMTLSVRAGKGL